MLSRGPLVKRLGLSRSDAYCSRDEYSLLLLVQQGKISEDDLREVREAFDSLDVDKSGILWSKDLELLRARKATPPQPVALPPAAFLADEEA